MVMSMLKTNEFEKKEFYKWLSEQISSRQLSDYVSAFSLIDNHYRQNGLLTVGIFDTRDIDTLKKILSNIIRGKEFKQKYPNKAVVAKLGLSYYIKYLERTMLLSAGPNSLINESLKCNARSNIEETVIKMVDGKSINKKANIRKVVSSELENHSECEAKESYMRTLHCEHKVNYTNKEESENLQIKSASSNDEWSLLDFLDNKNVKYVDKTKKGGCVWIIGGYELTPIIEECREHGVNFRFSERGGLASGKKPAWWVRLKENRVVKSESHSCGVATDKADYAKALEAGAIFENWLLNKNYSKTNIKSIINDIKVCVRIAEIQQINNVNLLHARNSNEIKPAINTLSKTESFRRLDSKHNFKYTKSLEQLVAALSEWEKEIQSTESRVAVNNVKIQANEDLSKKTIPIEFKVAYDDHNSKHTLNQKEQDHEGEMVGEKSSRSDSLHKEEERGKLSLNTVEFKKDLLKPDGIHNQVIVIKGDRDIHDTIMQDNPSVQNRPQISDHNNGVKSTEKSLSGVIIKTKITATRESDSLITNRNENKEQESTFEKEVSQKQDSVNHAETERIISDQRKSKSLQRTAYSEDDSQNEPSDKGRQTSNDKYQQDRTSLLSEEQRTFEEIFEVEKENYEEDSIENLNLHVRAINALARRKIFTVKDFLMMTPQDLFESKSLGVKSFNEIVNSVDEYCSTYRNTKTEYVSQSMLETRAKLIGCKEDVFAYRWDVLSERYNDDVKVSEALQNLSLIDINLLEVCKNQCNTVEYLRKALSSFYNQYLPDDLQVYAIEKDAKLIPQDRLNHLIRGYIFAYTDDANIESCLKNQLTSQDMTVRNYIIGVKKNRFSDEKFKTICRFIRWLSFDLYKDLTDVLENMHLSDREMIVVTLRGNGKTLEQVGQQVGVTRERVRQIESKVERRFAQQLRVTNLIRKLYAEKSENVVLTRADCRAYFGEESDVFLNLLRITKFVDYEYDSDYDVFVIAKTSVKESILEFMDTVPESFSEEKLVSIQNRGITEYGLTVDLIQRAINDRYTKSGRFYSTSKITLKTIYNAVLREFYPDGIHVYDENELLGFRKHVHEMFGDVDLPENNRALTAGICRDGMTILCGRGKYKLTQKQYMPDALAKKIKKYIDRSKNNVFFMNTIFYEFQDELVDVGVDNKYYLQGILKSLYGDIYYFRRDYLMKNDVDTSIHGLIQDYVKKNKYPVSKEDIMRKFPGVTEIVIAMALSDKSFIKLWGRYMNASSLQFSPKEMKTIDGIMQKMVFQGNGYAYSKDIYAELIKRIPYALSRNSINLPYELLSVLGYIYSKKCIISRPYIALRGVEIGKTSERMDEFICNDSVVSISAITAYAKRIHMTIYSTLTFLEGYFDKYLLVNSKQIASYDYIGINQEAMEEVDQILQTEVYNTMAIRELQCINQLPHINVNWNEWLIFSIINVVSEKLEVATSDPIMKRAIPLISPKGKMNNNYDVSSMDKDYQGDLQSEQSIDNLDDMLEEFIEELFDDIDFDN